MIFEECIVGSGGSGWAMEMVSGLTYSGRCDFWVSGAYSVVEWLISFGEMFVAESSYCLEISVSWSNTY